MTSKELFEEKFQTEITNVEFFGTQESGITCILFSPEGNCIWSNTNKKHSNIYDAFEDAYNLYRRGLDNEQIK